MMRKFEGNEESSAKLSTKKTITGNISTAFSRDLNINQNIQRTIKIIDQYRNEIWKIIQVSNHRLLVSFGTFHFFRHLMDLNLSVLVTDRSVLPFRGIILASVPQIIPEGCYKILFSLNWPRAAGLSALFANILASPLPF